MLFMTFPVYLKDDLNPQFVRLVEQIVYFRR
jgi:hypothetical protein